MKMKTMSNDSSKPVYVGAKPRVYLSIACKYIYKDQLPVKNIVFTTNYL